MLLIYEQRYNANNCQGFFESSFNNDFYNENNDHLQLLPD